MNHDFSATSDAVLLKPQLLYLCSGSLLAARTGFPFLADHVWGLEGFGGHHLILLSFCYSDFYCIMC